MKKFPQHQPPAEMRKLLILRLRGKHMNDMENRSLDSKQSGTTALQKKRFRIYKPNWMRSSRSLTTRKPFLPGRSIAERFPKKAEQIFSKLSDCSCSVISSESGDYVLLCASARESLLPDEERIIENWLLTETNLSRAELRMTVLDSEETAEPTDGT